uniref:RING-type domain-containing protein n=1 Tax=Strongyloides venezuelensis TaxID=75913 RepID=A0A0K0FNK3_STRVS
MDDQIGLSSYAELITCKKCNNFFNKPITQICGHTFCQDCFSISSGVDGYLYSICHECGFENRYQNCLPNIDISVKSLVESYLESVKHLSARDKDSKIICTTCKVPLDVNEVFTCKTCNNLQNFKYSFYCGNCGWTYHKKHAFIQVEFITIKERERFMEMFSEVFSDIQNNHFKLSKLHNDIVFKRDFLSEVTLDSAKDFESLIKEALKKEDPIKDLSDIRNAKKVNLDLISKGVHDYNETMLVVSFLLNDLEKTIPPIQNNFFKLSNVQKVFTNSQMTLEYEPPCKKK